MAGKAESRGSELSPVPSVQAWARPDPGSLAAAGARQGFVNYATERRHFSLPGAAATPYDFSIRPRR